jgi:putative FmdB family regulatory protein
LTGPAGRTYNGRTLSIDRVERCGAMFHGRRGKPPAVIRGCNRGGTAMPTYDFVCEKCKKSFSLVISIAEYEKGGFFCPKCKGGEVKRKISPFQVKTTRKS